VIQRGNNKEYIFDNANYKDYFVSLLRNAVQIDGAQICAYVVMSNHFHIALRSYEKPVSKIMHRINTAYSIFYNLKMKRTGHVFQGRYQAIPILDDSYLLAVIRYIHRNPVAAGLCARVEEYRWSSDRNYRGPYGDFVEYGMPFDMLANDRKTAREEYCAFVDVDDEIDWESFSYIDDESVAQAAEELTLTRALPVNSARPPVNQPPKTTPRSNLIDLTEPFDQNLPAAEFLEDILLRTGAAGIEVEAIKLGSRQRQLVPYKIAFAREAFRQGYSMKQIGQHINVTESSIYHYLK
jgi:REP element-mobilizing transposase RayT